MSMQGPETPAPSVNEFAQPAQITPEQSQYVPPLQSWPPQAPLVPAEPKREGLGVALAFTALGLFIPITAFINAAWAFGKARSSGDRRYFVIAGLSVAIIVLTYALQMRAYSSPYAGI
jgi:hypothetical protein